MNQNHKVNFTLILYCNFFDKIHLIIYFEIRNTINTECINPFCYLYASFLIHAYEIDFLTLNSQHERKRERGNERE